MIILRPTFFNTSTMFTSSNGTSTVANLFDRNRNTQWASDNAGTDATTATFRIVFPTTQTVSQIVLLNHNLENFTIKPNTTTSDFTPSISSTTNSATNLYFSVGTLTAVKEIVITMNATISADEEKRVGEFIASNLLYDFTSDRLPPADSYRPRLIKKQIIHEMSDGGVALYNIRDKFAAEIDQNFVPTSSVDNLRDIYDLGTPFLFIPFETATSWNGDIAECVWPGDFNFFQFSDNNKGNGYQGTISLRQTPGGAF